MNPKKLIVREDNKTILNPNKVFILFERLEAQDTNPKTELIYHSNFELLISVILSAQMTDKGVNKATEHLFKVADTPEKMLELTEDKLKEYIRTINLYHSKAKHIIQTCKTLVEKYHSEVPANRTDLESLPGVGHKTASVVLNAAFNESTIAVDTHVFRVSNRTGLAIAKNVKQTEKILLEVIPDRFKQHASHWLVLQGRYICTAKKPKCGECILESNCPKLGVLSSRELK